MLARNRGLFVDRHLPTASPASTASACASGATIRRPAGLPGNNIQALHIDRHCGPGLVRDRNSGIAAGRAEPQTRTSIASRSPGDRQRRWPSPSPAAATTCLVRHVRRRPALHGRQTAASRATGGMRRPVFRHHPFYSVRCRWRLVGRHRQRPRPQVVGGHAPERRPAGRRIAAAGHTVTPMAARCGWRPYRRLAPRRRAPGPRPPWSSMFERPNAMKRSRAMATVTGSPASAGCGDSKATRRRCR